MDSKHIVVLFVTNFTKGGIKDTQEWEYLLKDILEALIETIIQILIP